MSKKASNPGHPEGVIKPPPPPVPPQIREGTIKKGGWNERPTSTRPSPPKGQGGVAMKEKIVSIEGGRAKESDFVKALHAMREGMKEQIEFFTLLAPIHKAKFDALVKEGFTEAQALELSKDLYGGLVK